MADNPVSWFLLAFFGLYFICRFICRVVKESEAIKAERERQVEEYFHENSIDKSNIVAYNRYINKGGRYR